MKIKKIISAVLCSAVVLTSAGCSQASREAPGASEWNEPPTAQQVAEDMRLGLNLGNTMEAYEATGCEKITFEWIPVLGENTPFDYEQCWGAEITTQEIIDGIKHSGFNAVRIPVFWGNMMKNDGNWDIDPDYIGRVREIVDYCQNAGLYAVINIHHFDEFIIRRNSVEDCEKIFTHIWTQIAEYFKDYPMTVIFEGFNEYLGGSQFNDKGELKDVPQVIGYTMTNRLNQAFVDAVRATGGNNSERVLIVSGYWTNIDLTTAERFKMPDDTVYDRLMVSVHYVDNSCYWSNSIGGKYWEDYIIDQCEKLKTAFTDKGIPVFIGETTAYYPKENFAADAKIKDSSKCLEKVLDKLGEYGFVPVIWDTPDGFYSRTEYKLTRDSDSEVIAKINKKYY